MKKNFYYFLILVCTLCMAAIGFSSCENQMDDEILNPYSFTGKGKQTVVVETKIVYNTDTIIVYKDGETVYVHDSIFVHDTLYVSQVDTVYIVQIVEVHDTIYQTVETHELKYALGSNKYDNVVSFDDNQPTFLWDNGVLVRMTDENRNAQLSNESDTLFVSKVDNLQASISRPATRSSSSVRGQYNMNTVYNDYDITANDGYTLKLNAANEAASAEYLDEMRDLLFRKVNKAKVISINDEPTQDTIVKDKKIYRKVNRTVEVEIESLNRPLMGPEIVTLDTMKISSANASKNNGIAVVYVETGDTVPDPVIPDPDDPVIPDPINPDPDPDPQPADDGYTINGEKIESIMFSYTTDPNTKTLKEVLLVRTAHYVMPVVDKKKQSATKVSNPNAYNSAAWVGGAWVPATLSLSSGFVWKVNGEVVANATDATIDWLANKSGISSISKNDFLKNATFVNEGKTTRVYVNNKLYMTLK